MFRTHAIFRGEPAISNVRTHGTSKDKSAISDVGTYHLQGLAAVSGEFVEI